MNILYVAFPCNPYSGSESKIGWNIPLENSKIKENKIIVITIRDMKNNIDNYIKKNGNVDIEFYYVDLPTCVKKVLKRLPTIKLQLYHKLVYRLIKKRIVEKYRIDIIHQITPVEFRSIGNYYKFKNVKFIVGPVGGGEYIPVGFSYYIRKNYIIEKIRKVLNYVSKMNLKSNKQKLKNTNIIFANNETKEYLNLKQKINIIMPEIGLREDEIVDNSLNDCSDIITFIVSGRLIYRKGHEFLLETLKTIPENYDYIVKIIGDGKEYKNIQKIINKNINLKKHVKMLGNIDFSKMDYEYSNSDILIMPSLRETTGSVVLEAMAKGLPVITIKRFGAKEIIDNKSGYLYDGNSKEELIESLKNIILNCIENKELVRKKSKVCLKKANDFLFSKKIIYYNELYKEILKND